MLRCLFRVVAESFVVDEARLLPVLLGVVVFVLGASALCRARLLRVWLAAPPCSTAEFGSAVRAFDVPQTSCSRLRKKRCLWRLLDGFREERASGRWEGAVGWQGSLPQVCADEVGRHVDATVRAVAHLLWALTKGDGHDVSEVRL